MAKILQLYPEKKGWVAKLASAAAGLASPVLTWGVVGFLLGRTALFGELWPLGLAYLAAMRAAGRSGWGILPQLAVPAGLISVLGARLALPYCACYALLWLLPGEGGKYRKYWLVVLCLLIKIPLHFVLHSIPMVFVVGLTECVLAVFFFDLFFFALKRCLERRLACAELQAVLVCFTLIVSVSWRWGGFSPRLFLIAALIVLGARLDGLRITCILGPALALLSLLVGEPAHAALFVVISGLLTGVFSQYWWGYYLAPVLAVMFSFPGPMNSQAAQSLLLLVGAVFAARRVPEKHLKQLARLIPGTKAHQQQDQGHGNHLKQVLDEKIDQYLTVFEELEKTLMGVNDPLFQEQMRGMAELLKGMKEAFPTGVNFTKDFEGRLLNRFAKYDLAHISVIEGLDGLEISGALQGICSEGCVCEKIAEFCTAEIESQKYGVVNYNCKHEGICGFRIAPCPRYRLEIGRAKVARAEISGDSQVSFEITNSKVAILLSDGMGVGWKAYTESSAAVRLLERMIKAGYDLAAAVSLVNRLLLLRNQDEMFVTIDLVVIDLFSGQLEFVKIGSAPSFIKRGREVEIVFNHSLPVGVLSQVEVETDRRILKKGEVLVMATDGVLDAQRNIVRKEEWMCWNLRRLQDNKDTAAMAAQILHNSLDISRGHIQDDMMVVVARLVPKDWEMDTYRRTQSSV